MAEEGYFYLPNWNAAHILADLNNLEFTRARTSSFEIFRETQPDQEVNILVEVIKDSRKMGLVSGQLRATCSLEDTPLAQYELTFGAREKQ